MANIEVQTERGLVVLSATGQDGKSFSISLQPDEAHKIGLAILTCRREIVRSQPSANEEPWLTIHPSTIDLGRSDDGLVCFAVAADLVGEILIALGKEQALDFSANLRSIAQDG